MRILVACPQCRRRYDASGRKVGSRFRCHCGAAVTVAQPEGHDSRVVRCASCGAPRDGGGAQCGFCRSDFTLHERDLHTVCPNCFTRVSDAARYCHSCAAQLAAEGIAGDVSPRHCPACQVADAVLHSRRFDSPDLSFMECDRCAGLWLGADVFAELTRQAAQQGQSLDPILAQRRKTSPALLAPAASGSFYRPCAECGKLMARRNYSRRSGVVIDLCADHGVWFDGDELTRILTWIRAGGKTAAERSLAEEHAAADRSDEIQRRAAAARLGAHDEFGRESWLNELAGETLKALAMLFSHRL